MSRRKVKTTHHSIERFKERIAPSGGSKQIQKIIKDASRYGVSYEKLPEGELKEFVKSKAISGKRVKVYMNIIFIFCTTSNKCITCYPIPKELNNGRN